MTTSKYDFKAVSRVLPPPHFTDLTPDQRAKHPDYIKVLEVAEASRVPKPTFSKYYVKCAVGRHGGPFIPAGNIEYGRCQALHGEESAANNFRAQFGDAEPHNHVLGFSGWEPGNIPACCGNCRDIMRDTLGLDLEIITGAPEGGIATVMHLREILFEDYTPVSIDKDVQFMAEDVLRNATRLENDIYSPPDIHPRRKYYTYLLSRGANVYAGATDLGCEFHPIYPLRDAMRQARRANDPFVASAHVVCVQYEPTLLDRPPDVMCKDRQHLLELAIQAELSEDGAESDPDVYLITCDGKAFDQEKILVIGAWTTTARKWLPFPFTLYAFGEEFVATAREKYRARLKMK